jgi:hypothetical protein
MSDMEIDWEVEIGGGTPVIEALWPGFVDLRQSPERITEIAEAAAFPALARLLLTLNGSQSPVWTAKCDVWEPETDEAASSGEVELAQGDHRNSDSVDCLQDDSPVGDRALACYVDLLPREGMVFARWQEAENTCRAWVARMERQEAATSAPIRGASGKFMPSDPFLAQGAESGFAPVAGPGRASGSDPDIELQVELIVRQAVAGEAEGFGVTAYLSAVGRSREKTAVAGALAELMEAFAASILQVASPANGAAKLQ